MTNPVYGCIFFSSCNKVDHFVWESQKREGMDTSHHFIFVQTSIMNRNHDTLNNYI